MIGLLCARSVRHGMAPIDFSPLFLCWMPFRVTLISIVVRFIHLFNWILSDGIRTPSRNNESLDGAVADPINWNRRVTVWRTLGVVDTFGVLFLTVMPSPGVYNQVNWLGKWPLFCTPLLLIRWTKGNGRCRAEMDKRRCAQYCHYFTSLFSNLPLKKDRG